MEFLPFFLLGLATNLHCLGMCGPLALALPGIGAKTSGIFIWHLGRILGYGLLGLVCGFAGQTITVLGISPMFSLILGFLLLLMYLFPKKFRGLRTPEKLERFLAYVRGKWVYLLQSRGQKSFFWVGLFHFLLPCGLLYGALLMAMALGNPLDSMTGMLIFAISTHPLLLALSLGANFSFVKRLTSRSKQLGILILAAWLILRGMGLLGHPVLAPGTSSADNLICLPKITGNP
ncbi:MAG: sulfite exporter TauE/SafE family protein [Candidatus Cloacimonetes bacterium]|nr:sulfite exporter TauE/SafE family protein [Candidatus Cloacimonadota bacterium]